MAVNYDTATKTARMTAVRDAIDSGAGPGYIEICSAGFALVLATIVLGDPCGTVTGDTLTFTMPKSDTSADNNGTAAVARVKDSGGTVRVNNLTVGTGGTDIVLGTTTISSGQVVQINSASIQHAP